MKFYQFLWIVFFLLSILANTEINPVAAAGYQLSTLPLLLLAIYFTYKAISDKTLE